MGIKERILTIRLMERINEDPVWAKQLGIEAKAACLTDDEREQGRNKNEKNK